jgi:predicted nucleotidyltransferase
MEELAATRGFLDHDIFTDHAGRIYFVLGHYQPDERVISLLKYTPDENGTWIHRVTGTHYARSYQHQGIDAFVNAESIGKSEQNADIGAWFIADPVFGTEFLEVPISEIAEYMRPEERLTGILESSDSELDDLEQLVKKIVTAVMQNTRLTDLVVEDIGITGSILWRGHSDRSDINLNVYGLENCKNLERKLELLAIRHVMLARGLTVEMKGFDDVPSITTSRNVHTSMLRRKPKLKLVGFKPGIQIRWCLRKGEFPVEYGSETYAEEGVVTVKVKVIDATFTLFYPAMVRVETLEGDHAIDRIMIYDTRFVRLLRDGDVVEITGLLQRISNSDEYQLLIGSKAHAAEERIVFLEIGGKS